MNRVRLLTAAGMLALASPAAAATIADCEKIGAPDAYNQCLASFGPHRGQRPKGVPTSREPPPGAETRQRFSRHSGGKGRVSGQIVQHRNAAGRMSLQFVLRPR